MTCSAQSNLIKPMPIKENRSERCKAPELQQKACLRYIPMWYFDGQACSEISGCDVEGNIFRSKVDCEATCIGHQNGDDYNEGEPIIEENYAQYYQNIGDESGLQFPTLPLENTDYRFKYGNPTGWPTYNTDDLSKIPHHSKPRPGPFVIPDTKNKCTESIQDIPMGKVNGMVQTSFVKIFACPENSKIYQDHDECERNCNDSSDICSQPEDSGHCRGYMPMWLWDAKLKECRIFIYGMCGGNKNRFGTEEACLKTCGDNNGVSHPYKPIPKNHFCPHFQKMVPNGQWKCSLEHFKGPIFLYHDNVKCSLFCDGKNYDSVHLTCSKGVWRKESPVIIAFYLKIKEMF